MSDVFATYPSLRGKPVLVTGGGSGIGAAQVAHFARQGARVGFLDIDGDAASATADAIAAEGLPAPWFRRCDLRDIDALRAAVAAAADALGPIGVLVNNAANDQRHAWEDVTPEYWDERQATNIRHQFFAIQAVAPAMKAAGGGSIINFGSISWHRNGGGMPAYTTAKAAAEGLTKGMARDLGPFGIRVNAVIPGWIMTKRQIDLWLTPEAEERLMRDQCIPARVVPDDVARLVLWLASDDSRMCTSQLWVCDGGWM